jgi:hypothetical protein
VKSELVLWSWGWPFEARARRLVVVIGLVVALVAGLSLPAAAAGRFTDDDYNRHEPYIEAIAAAGITQGTGDGRYLPNATVTRAQMATFLVRAFKLPAGPRGQFTDTRGSVHEASINALAAAGITTGCAPRRFCPNDQVTRAQMGTFLARAMKLAPSSRRAFDDLRGSVHEGNVNALFEAGVTGGCAPKRYCPSNAVKRDQMASFLGRALGLEPMPAGPYLLTSGSGEIDRAGIVRRIPLSVDRATVINWDGGGCRHGYLRFQVFDSDGRAVTRHRWETSSQGRVFELPRAGDYEIRINGLTTSSTGAFCYRLWDVTTPQRFSTSIGQFVTESGPRGLPVPTSGAGRIGLPGEIDIFKLSVSGPRRINWDGSGCRHSFTRFQVFDSDGRAVTRHRWETSSKGRVFELPRAGDYEIRINGLTTSGTGTYCFTLYDVTS